MIQECQPNLMDSLVIHMNPRVTDSHFSEHTLPSHLYHCCKTQKQNQMNGVGGGDRDAATIICTQHILWPSSVYSKQLLSY